MVAGHWLSVRDSDPRAIGLYARHYSAASRIGRERWLRSGISGPGEGMVLLTEDSRALWLWRTRMSAYVGSAAKRGYDDGQRGVMCSVFRNESPVLSSELIREACELAWQRWPGERLFTYVADAKIRSVNPGYCFKKAGWRTCGRNADGRLTILEILPEWAEDKA
jgi:hypothetical protein